MLTLKIIVLAFFFIISGGALFNWHFHGKLALELLAGFIAILSFSFMLREVLQSHPTFAPSSTFPTPAKVGTPQAGTEFTNRVGIEFVFIPPGPLTLGTACPKDNATSPSNEFINCVEGDEYAGYKVAMQAFYISKYEITQEQWMRVMRNNPAHFQRDVMGGDYRKHPVEQVSWEDILEFINRLNLMEKAADIYRLPTEAEWEYGARAGTDTTYFFGNDENLLGDYAWFERNSGNMTHPVGQKKPNPFGLYDMLGNVWEWTCSVYTNRYDGNEQQCASNSVEGHLIVVRGGSWYSKPSKMRSAKRNRFETTYRDNFVGFRVVARNQHQ